MKTAEPESPPDWKKDVLTILRSKQALRAGAVLLTLVLLRLGANWWLGRNAAGVVPVVKVEQLQLKTVDRTLNLPGNVEAIEQATLFAHVSGYLKKILVDEGDRVRKDQLIAVVDAPDIVQEYRNAKAEYDFKEITRKRYEQLLKEQVVSQQEYDKVDADAGQAKARFDNADANLMYTNIRAPFAGGIARRYKYPGDFISAPTKGGEPSPLFLLVNESTLRIAVNVPQKEVGSIAVGHPVDIRVDAFPERKFVGLISRVDALLDEATKTQRVLIDIRNPDTQLRAGMFASVVLHGQRKDAVPMVSRDAVHEDGDKAFILVVRNNKARRVAVSLGETEGGFVEVGGASLNEQDKIVVSGGDAVADGDEVQTQENRRSAGEAVR